MPKLMTLPNRRSVLALVMAVGLLVPALAARAQESTHAPAAAPAAAEAAHGEGAAAGERHYELIPDVIGNAQERHEAMMNAIWVIITFLILLAILYPTAWKQVLAGLKKREDRIRKDIADAETARLKAEATLKQYTDQIAAAERQVQDMLARATTEGDRIAAGIKAQAQKEVEEARDRANRDIQATRDQALAQIYERAAELSTNIAAKIIRRNLNADDQRDLVNQSLEQLQTVAK